MLRDETAEFVKPVPQRRIVEKMDEYMSRRDYAGAERHLLYWLAEAELGRDLQGQLMLRNEMVGHYRKTGQREKAMESAEKALELLADLGMEETISAGTTCVNIATACNAFGEYGRSMELFERARAAYEGSGYVEPQLLGGLYNNMALTCSALGRCEEALELYEKAAGVMAKVPDGELEQAITFLNMANTVEAMEGPEQGENRIFELVEKAQALLEKKGEELLGDDRGASGEDAGAPDESRGASGEDAGAPEDVIRFSGRLRVLRELPREEKARIGYYAFVCEKCAPTFEYYGYFLAAESLRETAERIYAAE